jgi:hypothetical protein
MDIARVTGWACGGLTKEPPIWGSFDLGGGDHEDRYVALGENVRALIKRFEPAVFAYERPNQHLFRGKTNRTTVEHLCGLCAVACEHAREAGISTIRTVDTGVMRHHFIQRNPKRVIAKAMTIKKCEMLGWPVDNDNEADALACFSFIRSLKDKSFALEPTPLFQSIGRKGER